MPTARVCPYRRLQRPCVRSVEPDMWGVINCMYCLDPMPRPEIPDCEDDGSLENETYP